MIQLNSIDALQGAIIAEVKALLPEIKTCTDAPDGEYLYLPKRVPFKLPAALVSFMRAERGEAQACGALNLEIEWQVLIITSLSDDRSKRSGRSMALKLAEHLHGHRFAVKNASPATFISLSLAQSEPEFNAAAAIWALRFNQVLTLARDEPDVAINLPDTIISEAHLVRNR